MFCAELHCVVTGDVMCSILTIVKPVMGPSARIVMSDGYGTLNLLGSGVRGSIMRVGTAFSVEILLSGISGHLAVSAAASAGYISLVLATLDSLLRSI